MKTGGSSEAVIGQATRVRGRVSGDGDVRLEGMIEGDIQLRGDLVIAEGGRATSNVDAHGVTVGGDLEGDIRAAGLVHLTSGARVRGNIQGESVAMDDGAEYSGRIMSEFELPPELGGASSGRRR
jgi:cytoskeletal protein CcmA (bactofilin family)